MWAIVSLVDEEYCTIPLRVMGMTVNLRGRLTSTGTLRIIWENQVGKDTVWRLAVQQAVGRPSRVWLVYVEV